MNTSIKRLLEVAGVDITKGKAKQLCEANKVRVLDLSKPTPLKTLVDEQNVDPSDFKKPGVYKIDFGSRGEIEDVKFLGNNYKIEVQEPDPDNEWAEITKVGNAYDVSSGEEQSEFYVNVKL